MKSGANLFLRVVLVLFGLAVLALLLVEPHLEGRNAQATTFQIYFTDPFLAYAYIASIPFFMGLFHAIKVLGHAGGNQEFSASTVRSVRTIRYCALVLLGFVAGGEIFIFLHESDDRAGGVVIGMVIAFAAIVVASAMAVFERSLQKAVAMKSEHDLVV